MERIVECVPNFSEGVNKDIINEIVEQASRIDGVNVLDRSMDKDHNRSVITFVGTPEGVAEAAFNMVRKASELIDMKLHKGEHPRMGATDVLPFIPIKGITMAECIEIAKNVGSKIGNELGIPVYLYEEAASNAGRKNLADVRKGEYEGFFEKIKNPLWKPDFGPEAMNEKSGCIAVGARFPLVAYNINLATSDIKIADNIAKVVRHIGGGLRFVKAMGVTLEDRGIVQVSMNLVNYEKTAIYRAYEMVKMEAKRYGVSVVGSEIVGLVPSQALIDSAVYYLQLENFDSKQVLENRLYE
jgi:glutamate formiminotransferase